MTLTEIKQQLRISEVLSHYGLQPDARNRMCCPFHEDKTPSMQIYPKTNTAYCFSGNCKTHGKSMDVIDFVMYIENSSKSSAIQKCKTLLGVTTTKTSPNKSTFLTRMFGSFNKAIFNSKPAQEYLSIRCLDYKKLAIGYNSGQFHHGSRRDDHLISNCLAYGLLHALDRKSKTGNVAYGVFGKWSIVFPLKNKEGDIVSLYFRSTQTDKKAKHYYLKNREGLYPSYPNNNTKKIILTESIIDAASLLQIEQISNDYEILSCYGTNGLTKEHLQAIQVLKDLEEIIFFFDNDASGQQATVKYGKMLQEARPQLQITTAIPINKDINETLQGHDESIFIKLLSERNPVTLIENEASSQTIISLSEPKITTSSTTELTGKALLKNLNQLIGKAGIVGEENSRMLLFLIVVSYVNKNPLHALVQGSSGSGKTHIISRIADLMPQEDVLRFTRITESSLYNWGEFDLFKKVVIIEDLDGLKEDALYALREFISNQVLRSSVTIKDKKGNNKSRHKIVKGQFSSLSATTKGETYEDNMSRSFLIAVDESAAQTTRIIDYQNRRTAGAINPKTQQQSIIAIQQFVRNLEHLAVVNPYATQLQLPNKVHKIRRLNEMYQSVIKQVTFLHQHDRKTNDWGQLITDIEDVEQATEILFESIVLKVDELDGSLRQFFERLKKYIKTKDQSFILREVRQELNISKTQLFRYMQSLTELEYVKQIGGYANKGIKYKISYWDNYHKIRVEIKDHLLGQIENLRKSAV